MGRKEKVEKRRAARIMSHVRGRMTVGGITAQAQTGMENGMKQNRVNGGHGNEKRLFFLGEMRTFWNNTLLGIRTSPKSGK